MANAKNVVSLCHLRSISIEEIKREIAYVVSTGLILSTGPYIGDPDIWKIKKTLTMSDVEAQTRFLIPKESVIEHIFKYLTKEEIRLVENENNEGLRITIFDIDTGSTHQLSFTRWKSSGSYVLKNNWNREFVERRKLKEGDKIGFFWNSYASRLNFRVLDRSVSK